MQFKMEDNVMNFFDDVNNVSGDDQAITKDVNYLRKRRPAGGPKKKVGAGHL
jgi:hypothetical protein